MSTSADRRRRAKPTALKPAGTPLERSVARPEMGSLMMGWHNRYPRVASAFHLLWLAILVLTPVLLSQLLYAALD
jgi:hypothetical protein